MIREPRFTPAFILLLSGFIAWVVHFLAIYGFTGLLCARPEWAAIRIAGIGIVPFGIGLLTAIALAGLVAVIAANGLLAIRRPAGGTWPDVPFYGRIIQGGALLGGLAIIWQGLFTILFAPYCN
jgi:hypothetical protein